MATPINRYRARRRTPASLAGGAAPPFGSGSGYGGFGGGSLTGWSANPPGARFDYAREAGRLDLNGVVSIAMNWLGDNFSTALIQVGRRRKRSGKNGKAGDYVANDNHPFNQLFIRPNHLYTAREIWAALIVDFKLDGNAYLLKLRSNSGEPIQLWWLPACQVVPYGSGDPWRPIDRYELQGGVGPVSYAPEDVVHFRDRPDPMNPLLGLGRLKAQLRAVVGLNRGDSYTAAILRNAHAGRWLVPHQSVGSIHGSSPEENELHGVARDMQRYVGGEAVGGVGTSTLPMDLLDVGMGPEQMMLDRILDRPEAMVCAATGLNSLVLNLPSSAGSRTYSNYAEARTAAHEDALIPTQGAFAESLQCQLLYRTDFDDPTGPPIGEWGDEPGLEVWFDQSFVPAMQEDADARAARAALLFDGDIVRRNEARQIIDRDPVDEADDGFKSELASAGAEDEDGGENEGEGEGDPFGADDDEDGETDDDDEDDDADLTPEAQAILDAVGLTWDEVAALDDDDIVELFSDDEIATLGIDVEDDEDNDDTPRPVKAKGGGGGGARVKRNKKGKATRSKNNPCGLAASALARRVATPADHVTLGKCRASGNRLRESAVQRSAGNTDRAAQLGRAGARGLTKTQMAARSKRARELVETRAAGRAQGAAKPKATVAKPEAKPKSATKPEAKPKADTRPIADRHADALAAGKAQSARLSDSERSALRTYSGSDYDGINSTLRSRTGGTPAEQAAVVSAITGMPKARAESTLRGLDGAFKKAKLDADATVYRGIRDPSMFGADGPRVGTRFRDDAYTSTTLHRPVAESFARDGGAVLEVRLPKGSRAIYADSATRLSGDSEYEMIVDRGGSYRVTGSRSEGGRTIFEAVLEGHDDR